MPFQNKPRDREGQAASEQGVRDVAARGGPFVAAVEATRMPMVVTDPGVADNPIVYANATFLELCGYGREEVLSQNYFFLVGEHADPEAAQRVKAAMTARRSFIEEVPFTAKDGHRIWVSMFVSPVVEDGQVVQHFASFLDVTDRVERERELREAKEALERRVAARTRSLEQANTLLQEEVERRQRTETVLRDALARGEEDLRCRDFLIREVNHRTKNAMQLAMSLLNVQARATEDPASRGTLEAAMGRLRRIGDVHALLTYGSRKPTLIDFADYLDRPCRDTAEGKAPERVRVEVEAAEEVVWEPDLVIPLGLIAGEALANALKHAFPEGRSGRVLVRLALAGEGRMRLRIEDDGVGLPADRREGSLGLRLIEMFARQVQGLVRMEAGPGGRGTMVVVTFPDPDAARS